jgi:putative tryptophan/tyrosine transport system substrate-binding protein
MRRRSLPITAFFLLIAGVGMFFPSLLGADEPVVVVLSSNSGPYKEAFQGFQEAFGQPVPFFVLAKDDLKVPLQTRVIVAIGGKAALYAKYPSQSTLIYCLAPGTRIGASEHSGMRVKIHTSPSPLLVISKMQAIQPSLKRLGVLWSGESIRDYFDQKDVVLKRFGIELVSHRVVRADDLPDHLRAMEGKVDAIWLPPDATMVTPKNFTTIKGFAVAHQIPFYVPSEGLVEQGAVASFSTSFKEIGALVARTVQKSRSEGMMPESVFPDSIRWAINASAAKACNLKIPAEMLQQADKLIP